MKILKRENEKKIKVETFKMKKKLTQFTTQHTHHFTLKHTQSHPDELNKN